MQISGQASHQILIIPHNSNLNGVKQRCSKPQQSQRRRRELSLKTSASLQADFVQALASRALQPVPGLAAGAAVNSTVYVLSLGILLKGLTPVGVAHSWVLGTAVYSAFGWPGYVLVSLYFLLGSAVTKIKLSQKEAEGIAEKRSGRRSAGSVWGSGLAGLVCAVGALSTQHHALWQAGFAASLVSKLSDTVSSEIGKAYGRTTVLSTSLKRVPRGTDGAVSLEGTAAGLGAALGFAVLAAALGLVQTDQAWLIAGAAFLANWAESVLGALLQGKEQFKWLSNDVVNMLQICLACYLAMIFVDF